MDTPDSPTHLEARDRWLTSGLLGIGLVTFAISASTTNLILAELMTSLRVELYQIHWVVTAASIARTIAIPAIGWLSGRFGPRLLYLLSFAMFSFGTLGSALAWDWTSLLFFRIVGGIGGGLIMPLTMAIFYQIFPPTQRGMALGLSLMGWSIGPSIGPLTGGYLLEFASWRIVYIMLLPLCGMGLLLAWWRLPTLKRPERRDFDHYGLTCLAIAVTTFLLALSQGRREGWDSQYIVTLFVVAAVTTIVFIIIELRHPQPLVELRLFCSIPFIMAVVIMCLTTAAFRSTGPMFPVLMQRILGFEPLLVAWTMLPLQILYGLSVLVVGRLSDRYSPHFLVTVGLMLYAAVFLGYSGISVWTTSLTMSTFLTLRFIAEALIVSPNNLTALRALPEHQVMMASGLIGLLRSVSNTLGPAVSAVLWDQRYAQHLQSYTQSSPMDSFGFTTAVQQLQNILVWMGETTVQVPTKTMALVGRLLRTEASTAAWQDYLLFNGLLAAVAVLPALWLWGRYWMEVESIEDAPSPSGSKPSHVEADNRTPTSTS